MKTEIEMEGDTLRMSRHFNYPRARVFEAWSDPRQVEQWWGCAQTKAVVSTMDFRTGGTFKHHMVGEGYGEMDFEGTYTEIVAPEKIAYAVSLPTPGGPVEMRVAIEFLEEDGGTRLVVTQTGFPMPELKQHVSRGMSASFDKLERVLASEPATA